MESPQNCGTENSISEEEEMAGAGQAEINGGNQDEGSKHHSGSKHKKKKHKHRSKHKKKQKHITEVKECKRKHKHKHKKHRRKEGRPSSSGTIDRKAENASPTSENPNVDDRVLLEDLEKQRALIKAELDSQLMEGKVQSGMGLILQGYNSGSGEDGEEQRNGKQCKKGSEGKICSPRNHSSRGVKVKQDLTDNKTSTKWRSHSKEKDRAARDSRGSRLSNSGKELAKERCRSKDRRCSRNQNQSQGGVNKSQSPSSKRCSAEKKPEQKEAQKEKHPSPHAEERRPTQDQGRQQSGSPAHSHSQRSYSKDGHSEANRDKRPGKSPFKNASSGKENHSPRHRRASSPRYLRSTSTHQREHQSHQAASSGSKKSYSPARNRTPARRGHSRSADRRRDSPSR